MFNAEGAECKAPRPTFRVVGAFREMQGSEQGITWQLQSLLVLFYANTFASPKCHLPASVISCRKTALGERRCDDAVVEIQVQYDIMLAARF